LSLSPLRPKDRTFKTAFNLFQLPLQLSVPSSNTSLKLKTGEVDFSRVLTYPSTCSTNETAGRSMPQSHPHLLPTPPVMLCYAVAALSVTAALIIARWLEINLHTAPVSLFLCAVMLSAWFGGIGPGVLAVVLSFLAFAYYFVPPIYSLAMEVQQIPRFLIFVLSALYIVPPVF